MTIKSFEDLEVWRKAITLTDMIYTLTERFPKHELFGLSSQMRRAAVSIASNIAEGSARGSRKEYAQFISIARGSLAELRTQVIISKRREYLDKNGYDTLIVILSDIGKMLMGLLQSLTKHNKQTTKPKL
ncbi:MAG: four helix bundle protein [Rickettsiales bacterium]|jgi:four helix bundle protein|nr:four helix bundle protein [Rickettsiales bacterium]